MLRKFQLKGGFACNTKYVVYDSKTGKCHLEFNDGTSREEKGYTLDNCLGFVKHGDWIEIKQDGEKCSGCNCAPDDGKVDITEAIDNFFIRQNRILHFGTITIDESSPYPPEPIDFSTAQVGDTLRCLLNGDVEVIKGNDYAEYTIHADDASGGTDDYTSSGFYNINHKNPCLIGWVDSDGNLCRTRPEPKIDWSKVAIDAPVEVTDSAKTYIRHFSGISPVGTIFFWSQGRTSHTTDTDCYFTNATYKLINTEEK